MKQRIIFVWWRLVLCAYACGYTNFIFIHFFAHLCFGWEECSYLAWSNIYSVHANVLLGWTTNMKEEKQNEPNFSLITEILMYRCLYGEKQVVAVVIFFAFLWKNPNHRHLFLLLTWWMTFFLFTISPFLFWLFILINSICIIRFYLINPYSISWRKSFFSVDVCIYLVLNIYLHWCFSLSHSYTQLTYDVNIGLSDCINVHVIKLDLYKIKYELVWINRV